MGCGRGCKGLSRWREHESVANEGEALLGQFGLEELIFRSGKEIGAVPGDARDQVVGHNRLAIEGALLIGISGELDGFDGACLFGDDGPQAAVVGARGHGEKRFEGARIEVGEEDSEVVGFEPSGAGAPVGRDIQEELRSVGLGHDVDGGVVDDGAELDMKKAVGGRKLFSL